MFRVSLARLPALQTVRRIAGNVWDVGNLQFGAQIKGLVMKAMVYDYAIELDALHEFKGVRHVMGEERPSAFGGEGLLKLIAGDQGAFDDEDFLSVQAFMHG